MLSTSALWIIEQLNNAGFEAYAVGGCVRDLLRGVIPDDVDITTNALPERIMAVFEHQRVIPTGLQHGTVTVLVEDEPFEITTYRTDGTYSDGRHPDSVAFTTSLREDLARRDFTINAMAYHPQEGVIDPFGGEQDLKNRVLRCVGDARTRFSEDALRIARLIRFMSVLDFECEAATAEAAHALADKLELVAAERKRVELLKLLMGNGFLRVATQFPDVMCRLVPHLEPLVGFEQHNPHHSFDVYTHSIRAVHHATKDVTVRLAALLHDFGKPLCYSLDAEGVGHFYGHPEVSEELAIETLEALRFDNATIRDVLPLVCFHDKPITDNPKQIKRYLSILGEETFFRLLQVKEADAAACHADSIPPDFSAARRIAEDLLATQTCLSLRDLAVNGHDLMALGIPKGRAIGEILRRLLADVLDERCDNDREVLMARAKEMADDV